MKLDIHVHVHDESNGPEVYGRAIEQINGLARSLSESTARLQNAIAANSPRRAIMSQLKLSEVFSMGKLDDAITDLTTKVQAETSVADSAIVLIQGIQARIDAAVAAASAAGATDAQLKSLTDLSASIGDETTKLSDAVSANTPSNPNP